MDFCLWIALVLHARILNLVKNEKGHLSVTLEIGAGEGIDFRYTQSHRRA